MLSGIYRAASAMGIAENRLDVISHNLANANTPGFRKSAMVVQTFEKALAEAEQSRSASGNGNAISTKTDFPLEEIIVNFSQGGMMNTGRSLDVAISGDGFLVVEGPDGPLYTRNGRFHVSTDGELVNAEGYTVTGDGGPISLGAATPGQVEISADGSVIVAGNSVGKLRTVTFEDNSKLEPVGSTMFHAPSDSPPAEAELVVLQGFQEQSNASPIHEMIEMIRNTRNHEAAERVLKAIDESLQLATNPRGN